MPDASAPVRRLQEALRRLAGQTRGRPLTGRTHQDADDTAGTVLTDDAMNFDPLPLLRALDLAGARVMVIGQGIHDPLQQPPGPHFHAAGGRKGQGSPARPRAAGPATFPRRKRITWR